MTESRMELFIETLTGTAFELSCSPLETIVSIKAKIQCSEGIPVSQQHLIWRSQELNDDLCLQDYRINDGATLKLVLSMRGGPINTRQISDAKKLKDLADYVERGSQTDSAGRPFTVLVFHDGDKVHMYTLMERGDCAVSPLSGAVSETSSITSAKNAEELDQEIARENETTREKIAQLQERLKALNINRPKKHPNPPSSSSSNFRLPPIHQPPPPNQQPLPPPTTKCHLFSTNTSRKNSRTTLDLMASNMSAYLGATSNKEVAAAACSGFLPRIVAGAGRLGRRDKVVVESPPMMQNSLKKYDPSRLKLSSSHRRQSTTGPPTTTIHVASHSESTSGRATSHRRPRTSPEKNVERKDLHVLGMAFKALLERSVKSDGEVEVGEDMNSFRISNEISREENLLNFQASQVPPERCPSNTKLPLLKAKKKSHKRCSQCSKKTGLATSYTCRCGRNFCATHRYAELHDCTYDYKAEGRRVLQLNNPVITAAKLPKI